MTFEATMTLAAVGVLLAVILFQVSHHIVANGMLDAMGNREGGKSTAGLAGRIERTRINTIENLAMFVPLALLAVAMGTSNTWTMVGAAVFVAARVAYAGIYILGIPGLRTASWTVGLGGTVALAVGLWM